MLFVERYVTYMVKELENETIRYFRVQANINLDAICNNIRAIRQIIRPGTKIMAVIKADGYGHGASHIASALDEIGVDAFAIAILEEGIDLRQRGIKKPMLILGYTPKEQYADLVKYDISQTVFDFNMAQEISKQAVLQGKISKIHIKVETGMNRIGFADTEESLEEILKISKLPNIEIEGIFTHFATADEADKTYANMQYNRYCNFVTKLEESGLNIPMKHVANSGAIIDMPEANFNMVRSGIITYGLYPSSEVQMERLQLTPAMDLKAHVVFVKDVAEGERISYGGTFMTTQNTKVATVSIGYGDGYPRALSNKGRVLIHGEYAPILGRICMDQFMVDVSHINNVEQGDVVTLVGRDGGNVITVDEIAELTGTIGYEIICGFGKRIPRVYYHHGKVADCSDFFQY